MFPRLIHFIGVKNPEKIPFIADIIAKQKLELKEELESAQKKDLPTILTGEKYKKTIQYLNKDLLIYMQPGKKLTQNDINILLSKKYISDSLKQNNNNIEQLKQLLLKYKDKNLTQENINQLSLKYQEKQMEQDIRDSINKIFLQSTN